MAFRMDAGPAGVKETARAPRIAISVVQLGRRDASSCYKKSVVTVRSGGSSWEVWLNVGPPAAAGEPGGPEPGLRQDGDGVWHVSGDADLCPDLTDYEGFCAAANARKIRPEPVLITRRWCPRRRRSGKERRASTPAPRRRGMGGSSFVRDGPPERPSKDRDGAPDPARAAGAGENYYVPLASWCDEGAEESVVKNAPAVEGGGGLPQAMDDGEAPGREDAEAASIPGTSTSPAPERSPAGQPGLNAGARPFVPAAKAGRGAPQHTGGDAGRGAGREVRSDAGSDRCCCRQGRRR